MNADVNDKVDNEVETKESSLDLTFSENTLPNTTGKGGYAGFKINMLLLISQCIWTTTPRDTVDQELKL